MSELIERYRPDLLIEVLPGTPQSLEKIDALAGYTYHLVTSDGLNDSAKLYASDRDWLLTWPV